MQRKAMGEGVVRVKPTGAFFDEQAREDPLVVPSVGEHGIVPAAAVDGMQRSKLRLGEQLL